MRDLASRLEFKRAVSPAAATSDNTPIVTQILDRIGYEAAVLLILAGQLADADATFAVTIEHGDAPDLSDATPVQADQLNGTLATASFDFSKDDQLRKIGYVGAKRYVRGRITPANNTGAAFIAAAWILGASNQRPTPAIPA